MGLLDMLFGGESQPQQNSLPMEELRQLGLSDGLINYYQQEQAKAQKAAMWNNVINGAANIASGAQGMGARFGVGGDGSGGGSGGPGANTPLSLDGLVDRALKFSQVREGLARQKQMAEARAAIPALAAKLGVPTEMVAALDPSDLSKMYQQMRESELQAQLPIKKEDAAFDAAGIPVEQRQEIRRRAYDPKTELATIETPDGKSTVFKKPNAKSETGYDLIGPDGRPYATPQPKWKQETIKTPGGDFTVNVRPNPQSKSGFDVVDPITGDPVDVAALQAQAQQAAAGKKAAETAATNVAEKQAGLGRALNGIDEFSASVQDVLNDPTVNNYVGSAWGQLTSNIAGTDAADAAAKVNQLKARAFLIGAQSLKGQGNLTETEGAKLEAAIGRLDPKQKPEQFRKALQEIAVSLQRLRQIALEEAGGQLQSRPQAVSATPNDPAAALAELQRRLGQNGAR